MNTPLDTLSHHFVHDKGMVLLSALLGAAGGFLAPVQAFLLTVLGLVACDVITGIWKSKKAGNPITANKLGNTVQKVVLYPVAILISQVMVTTFFKDVPLAGSLTYIVALFISAVEFQSNIENIGAITGIDLWSQVKGWIASKVKTKSADPS